METCKYGSGADKRKPTAVKRKGVVYRAYKSLTVPFQRKCRHLKNTTIKNYRFYGPGYTLHLKRQLI